jgi:hypothetical protein
MVSITMLQRGLQQKSVALAIPWKIASPFRRDVLKWVKSSGEEWTVDRLKAIKLDIIRRFGGLPPVGEWITRDSKGNPKGSCGLLARWMFRKERNFARGLQLLQVLSVFYSHCLTEKQKKKFLDGVQSEPPTPDAIDSSNQLLLKGWNLMKRPHFGRLRNPPALEELMPSPSKRAPLRGRTVPEENGIVDSISYLYDTREGISHLNRFYESHYKFVLQTIEKALFNDYGHFMSPNGYPRPLSSEPNLLAGRIGLIQEPGYKLRAVANPGRVFQQVLKPFGDAIYDYIKQLPWDCTFDQGKAIPVLQDWLDQGKMVYSIDLSGATDYFPLKMQDYLLRLFCDKSSVDLFSELSKADWEFPKGPRISWKRGQPLGLYPSFGAFALTHGYLLLGLLGKEYSNEFFVLGDDVVILDDLLASRYLQQLKLLGCPVSPSKTLTSTSLCEFAGKVITSSRVIPQLKWREVSDDSFLDIARLLGPRSISLFRPRQIQVIRELSEVPEFLGGLGWNPNGKPLEDRVKAAWIWADKEPVDHLMGYSSLKIRNLMASDLFGLVTFSGSSNGIIEGTTLDQRVSLLTSLYLGKVFENFPKHILGKNIDMVSLRLSNGLSHANLPFNPGEGESLRPSLLDSWEAKLHHLR